MLAQLLCPEENKDIENCPFVLFFWDNLEVAKRSRALSLEAFHYELECNRRNKFG